MRGVGVESLSRAGGCQPSNPAALAAMAQAVFANIGARCRIVGTIASGAIGLRGRGSDHDLGGIGQWRAIGVAGEDASCAEPGAGWIRGEISGEKAVSWDIARVIAVV